MYLLDTNPKVKAFSELISQKKEFISVDGLVGSSAAVVFSSIIRKGGESSPVFVFIMDDEEEAGYFYHDLMQTSEGQEDNILFFPSSFRYGYKDSPKDAANEVLRTDVLSKILVRLQRADEARLPLYVVTYPEALKERVVSKTDLDENTLTLKKGESYDSANLESSLFDLGFCRTDYVYEPGQFAVRGSIIDIYSFSCENPYRIDFFGDEIDSIRTFDVQSQLSVEKMDTVTVVPELGAKEENLIAVTDFFPQDAWMVMNDEKFVEDRSELSFKTFKRIILGKTNNSESIGDVVHFSTARQPLFHKNFDMMREEFVRLQGQGYKLFIFADNEKQQKRLKDIFDSQVEDNPVEYNVPVRFKPVNKAIHSGFIDNDLKVCFFTDHQIFDRYHKYSLKSDKARKGKMALTLKEIQQFEVGDYVVHIDHGVGRFGGLVKLPENGVMVEKIMITYQNEDTIYVSIHALHKLSKYKGKEGEAPKLNRLGTGTWEKMKERVKTKVKDIARDLIKLYAKRMKEKGFAYAPDDYMQHELESSFMYEDTPDQYKATQDVKADMEKERPMDRLVCGDVGFGKTEVAVRAAFKAAVNGKQVAVMVPTTVLAYQHYQTFHERLKDFPVTVDYLSRARDTKTTKDILSKLEEGKIDIIIGTHKLIGKQVKFKDLGLLIIDEEQKFGVAVKEKLRQMKVNVDTLTMTATPIPRTLQFSLMGARDMSIIQTPPTNRYPIRTEIHTFDAEVIKEAINFEMERNGQVFFVNNRINNLEDIRDMIVRCVPDARVCIGHGRMNPTELEEVILGFMNYDYDVMLSTTIVENGVDIPNANTIIINSAQNYGLSDLHQMRGRVGRSNKKAFCYLLAPPLAALNDDARRRLQALETFSDLGMGLQVAMQDLDIRGAGNLLGAEQSGFIADLGYETYQKVLKEAMKELRQTEFNGLMEQVEADGASTSSSSASGQTGDTELAEQLVQLREEDRTWVDDVTIESDLPTYFHDDYVPTSGERIVLYRELDSLENEDQLKRYVTRLTDRFGAPPKEAEELINIMPLKWTAGKLGIEKITMKEQKMFLYLISNFTSSYYTSPAFGKVIDYATHHPRETKLRDGEKRFLSVKGVASVSDALRILKEILG